MKPKWIPVVAAGVLIGDIALAQWKFGNPANMGFCTACFERDIACSLGAFQYRRTWTLSS